MKKITFLNSSLFYHITSRDLGNVIKLEPKIPENSVIAIEGNIPRICVSDDLFGCIRSIISAEKVTVLDILYEFSDRSSCDDGSFEGWMAKNGYFKNFSVYCTKAIPFIPPASSDFRLNREGWFLQPTLFERIGFLCVKSLLQGRLVVDVDSKVRNKEFKYSDFCLLKLDNNQVIKPLKFQKQVK